MSGCSLLLLSSSERHQCDGEEHLQPDGPGHRLPVHRNAGQPRDQAAPERWVGLEEERQERWMVGWMDNPVVACLEEEKAT